MAEVTVIPTSAVESGGTLGASYIWHPSSGSLLDCIDEGWPGNDGTDWVQSSDSASLLTVGLGGLPGDATQVTGITWKLRIEKADAFGTNPELDLEYFVDGLKQGATQSVAPATHLVWEDWILSPAAWSGPWTPAQFNGSELRLMADTLD